MDWRCGSSSRAPALQMWSPEFKSQSHRKKKELNFYFFLDLKDKGWENVTTAQPNLSWLIYQQISRGACNYLSFLTNVFSHIKRAVSFSTHILRPPNLTLNLLNSQWSNFGNLVFVVVFPSASQVARITGMRHQHLAIFDKFWKTHFLL
jgi:hypothetical protein